MDKRDRSDLFRQRLLMAMTQQNINRSDLARATKVDRSTIGQLLHENTTRLPNAQLAADAATALGVSTDWLLGLTNRPERPGDIMAAAMALSPAERSSADAQLLDWHKEAAGYKIRHVPATLPDLLKTDKMVRWEYASQDSASQDLAIAAMREQCAWLRSGVSDYEIALPIHELHACSNGSSYYAGLAREIRRKQLQTILDLCEEMYPRLRLFLFDAHQVYSAPVTVFGPNLAVIYVGQFYLAFRESARIRSVTDHFDWLVRHAKIDAHATVDYIHGLLKNN